MTGEERQPPGGAEMPPAWEGLWAADGDGAYLVGGRCGSCGKLCLGLREFCPHCHATGSLSAEHVGRRGVLYTATVIHQAPAGFEAPYRAGYVDIEDGVRVFAHIETGEEAPRIGEDVELTLAAVKSDGDGRALSGPVYRRVRRGGSA